MLNYLTNTLYKNGAAICICLICMLIHVSAFTQSGTWVWVKGSDTVLAKPVYGVQGLADINNNPGGLWAAGAWVDLNGNFWLFGGTYDSISQNKLTIYNKKLNDLWKYDPYSNMWTWMKGPGKPDVPAIYGTRGIASPLNNPDTKLESELTWTDDNNNLWLYGYLYDDLWMYNINTNEWTWVSGGYRDVISNNISPGERGSTTTAWLGENNMLYLWGGGKEVLTYYNDMWRYDIASNQWALVNGTEVANLQGNYGQKGIEDISNIPPPETCKQPLERNGWVFLFIWWV